MMEFVFSGLIKLFTTAVKAAVHEEIQSIRNDLEKETRELTAQLEFLNEHVNRILDKIEKLEQQIDHSTVI